MRKPALLGSWRDDDVDHMDDALNLVNPSSTGPCSRPRSTPSSVPCRGLLSSLACVSLDWCHACRVNNALNLVKLLASKHGAMQQATFNSPSHSLLRLSDSITCAIPDWCCVHRVDDALNLVKLLASKHGAMQQTTLNSLIRSLLNANQAPRALRMLSIMLNMGLRPYRTTIDALIAGCAQNSNSVEAANFYW